VLAGSQPCRQGRQAHLSAQQLAVGLLAAIDDALDDLRPAGSGSRSVSRLLLLFRRRDAGASVWACVCVGGGGGGYVAQGSFRDKATEETWAEIVLRV
jgi:hypothetical protein